MNPGREYWDERLRENWNLRGVGLLTLSHSYNRRLYRVRGRVFRRAIARLRSDWSRAVVLDESPTSELMICRKGRGCGQS